MHDENDRTGHEAAAMWRYEICSALGLDPDKVGLGEVGLRVRQLRARDLQILAAIERLAFLPAGVGSVASREHGQFTSELITLNGRPLAWITVEPHALSFDLTVEQLDAITLSCAELGAAALTQRGQGGADV